MDCRRISHRTHHQNHGHVEKDESWHPVTAPLFCLCLGSWWIMQMAHNAEFSIHGSWWFLGLLKLAATGEAVQQSGLYDPQVAVHHAIPLACIPVILGEARRTIHQCHMDWMFLFSSVVVVLDSLTLLVPCVLCSLQGVQGSQDHILTRAVVYSNLMRRRTL
jgi:hypothetical protein